MRKITLLVLAFLACQALAAERPGPIRQGHSFAAALVPVQQLSTSPDGTPSGYMSAAVWTAKRRTPQFDRVYPLDPQEGVFAYSRVSPDGALLAYASETRGGREQTITVVDLRTKEILFEEPGIDAYWSVDGTRMIYLAQDGRTNVSIRHHESGRIAREVAPVQLGDYFSWGVTGGRDRILTIESNYYFLDGDRGVLPARTVQPCEGIGRGERPLLSREGDRITTFVRGTVVVRSLVGCDFILDTGIRGAKADFAWGGRYIAFHSPKERGAGYDIRVVDIEERTVRTITNFEGSSYFPSWTRDGRLSFRYDGPDYRGFMMASDVLSAPAEPLPSSSRRIPADRDWDDIFPETDRPESRVSVVFVWGPWSAHSPAALGDLDDARDWFSAQSLDVSVMHATDPGSYPGDAERLLEREGTRTPRIPLAPERLPLTEAHNQNPTTLLFRDGVLVDRRMGALTDAQIREWVGTELLRG